MPMKRTLQLVSWIALTATIVPPLLYLADSMPLDTVKTWMLAGTVVWFVTVPMWMEG
jgi:hypothetical protein